MTWGCPTSHGAIRLPLYSVVAVQATKYAFTSLHEGGSLHSWGKHLWGGKLPTTYERVTGAKEVQSTHSAFAALFEDQTVRAWGSAKAGGMLPEYNKSYGESNGFKPTTCHSLP